MPSWHDLQQDYRAGKARSTIGASVLLEKEWYALGGKGCFFLGEKAVGQLVESAVGAVFGEEGVDLSKEIRVPLAQGNGP